MNNNSYMDNSGSSPFSVLAVLALIVFGMVFSFQAGNAGDVNLGIDVIESSGGQVSVDLNGNYTLFAPAKYKVMRDTSGDNCYYNLTDSEVYGKAEDSVSRSVTSIDTYRITCQSLVSGRVNSKSVTVTVLSPTEIRAASQTLIGPVLSAAR